VGGQRQHQGAECPSCSGLSLLAVAGVSHRLTRRDGIDFPEHGKETGQIGDVARKQRRDMRTETPQVAALLAVLFVAHPAAAQDSQPAEHRSHWGVTTTFVPEWSSVPELYEVMWAGSGLAAKGKEFRIGVVRGSEGGGDWSVTLVRNRLRSDQILDHTSSYSVSLPPDFRTVQTLTDGSVFTIPEEVEVFGVKYEKFTPFVRIRDRVQIGLTYGAGIGSLRGSVTEQRFENFDPDTGESIPLWGG